MSLASLIITVSVSVYAQALAAAPGQTEPLSLPSAIEIALERSPTMASAEAAAEASAARIEQARAALLPRLDYIESMTRSDNPVFVFGSLLNQGRFTESNFALDELNQPSPLSLYQSRFALEQTIFAGGRNWLEQTRARLGQDEATESAREAEMNVILRVVQAYFGVLVAEKQLEVAEDALAVGEEDQRIARANRDAGLATDADVLALEVRRSELEEHRIVARNLLDIGWMELNAALGTPLETTWNLLTPLTPADAADPAHEPETDSVSVMLQNNPELRRGALRVESAEVGTRQARAAFLPSVAFHAGWESDRGTFTGGGGTNWMVGLSLRVNLFNGLSDRARLKEAEASLRAAEAQERETATHVRQSLSRAELEHEAARQRLAVSEGAAARARESHRITRARYEGGLVSVSELLRSQNALMTSELRELRAAAETRLSLAAFERVKGTLSPSSEAIQP